MQLEKVTKEEGGKELSVLPAGRGEMPRWPPSAACVTTVYFPDVTLQATWVTSPREPVPGQPRLGGSDEGVALHSPASRNDGTRQEMM